MFVLVCFVVAFVFVSCYYICLFVVAICCLFNFVCCCCCSCLFFERGGDKDPLCVVCDRGTDSEIDKEIEYVIHCGGKIINK